MSSGGAASQPPSPSLFLQDAHSPSSDLQDQHVVEQVTVGVASQQQQVATQTQSVLDVGDGEVDTDEVSPGSQVTAQVVVSSTQPGVVAVVSTSNSHSLSSSPVSASSSDSPSDINNQQQQYIAVTVSTEQGGGVVVTGDTVAQSVHPTYVQYVDDTSPEAATIYATTNGQMAYPVYTMGEATATMYTPAASGQYYTPANQSGATYSQGQAQLLGQTPGAAAYILQQGVDAAEAHALITSNRASPPTVSAVQWLVENYETAEGVSLPRSTLYNHYLRHCNEHKLDPVNAASFGKLIRSVFIGLRTRRLGTRGNSKYHYYGIRVKPSSSLSHLPDESESCSPTSGSSGGRHQGGGGATAGSTTPSKRFKSSKGSEFESHNHGTQNHAGAVPNPTPQLPQHHQYLGEASGAIPMFPEIDFTGVQLPEDCTYEDVDTLRSIYREHCEAFLDAVMTLEFSTVESLWREFWRSSDNNNGDECEEEKYLSKTKLYLLCKCEPVQLFVRKVDFDFYQNLVGLLIPDVLRPIPSSLTQAIRNFAKGLEGWLTGAMNGCPEPIMNIKLCAVSAFAQTLRRYTSLNHLAQAARAVLQNSTQINQMLADLNRVDFHNVQEQASWVCQCDAGVVQRLEADFKGTLQQQNSLEQWAVWLKNVVSTVLKPYEGKPNFAKAARQFLLKWSFYSSMVIRDLTLRSAASFGSFHLIRLLYDEYMFYLIEHQVASATGETPIAVIGEKSNPSSYPMNQQQQQPIVDDKSLAMSGLVGFNNSSPGGVLNQQQCNGSGPSSLNQSSTVNIQQQQHHMLASGKVVQVTSNSSTQQQQQNTTSPPTLRSDAAKRLRMS